MTLAACKRTAGKLEELDAGLELVDTSGMVDTREGWLLEASGLLRPIYSREGMEYPPRLRMTVSLLPSKTRGRCYAPEASGDGTTELLIGIAEEDSAEVIAVLAHELVHASVGVRVGHKGAFVEGVRNLGLEGKATATTPGPRFLALVDPVLRKLGPFPHAALNFGGERSGPKKQATRMIKAECEQCGYTVRLTKKWIEVGPPGCPIHGPMAVEGGDEEDGDGDG